MTEAEKVEVRAAIATLQKLVAVAPVARLGLIAPLYAYPAGAGLAAWNALIGAAAKVPVIAVANPGSGPGAAADPAWTSVIGRAAAAGVRVVGYVSTSYGNRAVAAVQADIATWWRLYPFVSGCFLDEVPTDAAHAPLYRDYCAAIRAKIPGRLVVGNPGAPCDPGYAGATGCDVLVMRETAGVSVQLPTWAVPLPDTGFAVIVHGVSEPAMRAVVGNARGLGYGWTWVTDDADANVYDEIPTYFAAMVDALAAG